MKVKTWKMVEVEVEPWLKTRFGDHYAQISADTTLKLKSSAKDVARVRYGQVPEEVEELTKKFQMPPQGISDLDFVFGYRAGEDWVDGSIESDSALQTYIARYSNDWEIVQKLLGIPRQKTRHACLPGGELILCNAATGETQEIGSWKDGSQVETGARVRAPATLLDQGEREVWEFLTDSGQTIRLTPDHLVDTEAGWMTAQEALESGTPLKRGEFN